MAFVRSVDNCRIQKGSVTPLSDLDGPALRLGSRHGAAALEGCRSHS